MWQVAAMPVSSDAITIAVTSADGVRRDFLARTASIDFEAGTLEFKAGSPGYHRKFETAVLHVIEPGGGTSLTLHHGTASLSASALHILCEDFQEPLPG